MNLNNALPNQPATGGLAAFGTADTAPEFKPLPPGIYTARVSKGEFTTTKAGAEAYRMRFEVVEGDQTGQTVIRLWTFGPKALPYTQRDLKDFGLTTPAQLLSPFPEPGREYLVRLVVAKQIGDDRVERNDIKKIDVLSVTDSPAAAYTLPPLAEGGAE
jgi:hypothetical protein